jgi:hypothetical protein
MNAEAKSLISEVRLSLEALEKLESAICDFRKEALASMGTPEAMATAQFFANYYTCAETIFFRISQHFENNLPKEKWHSALLDAMRLEIPGIRPRVLSDSTLRDLDEFRRFRYFTRYYFDIDYDWRRLSFLYDIFEGLREPLRTELAAFVKAIEIAAE